MPNALTCIISFSQQTLPSRHCFHLYIWEIHDTERLSNIFHETANMHSVETLDKPFKLTEITVSDFFKLRVQAYIKLSWNISQMLSMYIIPKCELIPNIFILSVGLESLTDIWYNVTMKYQISLKVKGTALGVFAMSIRRKGILAHLIL